MQKRISCSSSSSFKPVKFYDITLWTGLMMISNRETIRKKFSNFWKKESGFVDDDDPRLQIFNLSSPGRAGEPNTREAGWPQGLAPSLERLCALCKELDSWLNGAPNRVVVLHARWVLSLSFLWTDGGGGGGDGRGRSVVEEGEEKLIPRICSGEAKNDWVWLCPLTWTTAASAADVIRRWTGLPWGDSSTTRLDPCRFPRIEGNHRGAWRRLPVCWRWDDKANFIAS